jgi:hypothetical protein
MTGIIREIEDGIKHHFAQKDCEAPGIIAGFYDALPKDVYFARGRVAG